MSHPAPSRARGSNSTTSPLPRWRGTGEARCVVDVARAAVLRHLRIGAQRSSQRLRRIIGAAPRADQPLWRDALLDPSLEGAEDIALSISSAGAPTASVAETVRAGAATAVRHPGHEK